MTRLRLFSIMIVVVVSAVVFAGIARPQTALQRNRRVAVTIDDLPANMFLGDLSDWQEMTAMLLAGLVRHEVPAIGFVNEGKLYIDGAPDPDLAYVALLQAWLNAGLELGNHTFSHPDLHRTPLAQYEQDILRGEIVTRRLLAARGDVPRYFRHPFLHTGNDLDTRDALHEFLTEHGYRIAISYVAYMDEMFAYYEQQSDALLGYEVRQILLIHANRLNAAIIDELLDMVRARGYRFITLNEALEDPAYRSSDEFSGRAGVTWLHRWAITAGKRGEFFGTEPNLPQFVHEVYADPPGAP